VAVAAVALVVLARMLRRSQRIHRVLLGELRHLHAEIDALQLAAATALTAEPPTLQPGDLDVRRVLEDVLASALETLGCEIGIVSCELSGAPTPIVVTAGIEAGAAPDLPTVLYVGAPPGVEIFATRFLGSADGRTSPAGSLSATLLHEDGAEATLTVYQPDARVTWTSRALADLELVIDAYRPTLSVACRLESLQLRLEGGDDSRRPLADVAAAELDRATRYGSQLSLLCLRCDAGTAPEPRLRSTDHAAMEPDGTVILLLTETGFAAARRCFDRIAAELELEGRWRGGIAEAFPGELYADLRRRALVALGSALRSSTTRAVIAPGPGAEQRQATVP
jgi:hypothetical protein